MDQKLNTSYEAVFFVYQVLDCKVLPNKVLCTGLQCVIYMFMYVFYLLRKAFTVMLYHMLRLDVPHIPTKCVLRVLKHPVYIV